MINAQLKSDFQYTFGKFTDGEISKFRNSDRKSVV